MTAYRFAILRYIPDPIRLESLNVGVIVASNGAPPVVRVLKKGEAKRLRWLGFDDDIGFLQDLAAEVRSAPTLGEGQRWDAEALERAHREWGGTVRVSEPRAALHEDPQKLCDDLYERHVASPRTRREPQYRARPTARRRVARALNERLPKEAVQRGPIVDGALERHTFDYGVSNEKLSHLITALSFDVPKELLPRLETEVDAAKWAVHDVRSADAKVPIAIVTIGHRQEQLLDRAESMYEALGARLIREQQINHWARGVLSEFERTAT